jgi:hypothetical protein
MKIQLKIYGAESQEIQNVEVEQMPTLKELQEIVGGYIEIVGLENGESMIVNEDGHRLNLMYNKKAHQYLATCRPFFAHMNIIVGNAIVVESKHII